MTQISAQPGLEQKQSAPGPSDLASSSQPRPQLAPDVIAKVDALVGVLTKGKALDVLAFDISQHSSFADALFIATATSARQAQALADQVLAASAVEKLGYLRMEGHSAGQWILVDCDDVIINILLPSTRELYRLEGLWSGCPILFGKLDPA